MNTVLCHIQCKCIQVQSHDKFDKINAFKTWSAMFVCITNVDNFHMTSSSDLPSQTNKLIYTSHLNTQVHTHMHTYAFARIYTCTNLRPIRTNTLIQSHTYTSHIQYTPHTHIYTSYTQYSPHTHNIHLTHTIFTSHTQYSPHTHIYSPHTHNIYLTHTCIHLTHTTFTSHTHIYTSHIEHKRTSYTV